MGRWSFAACLLVATVLRESNASRPQRSVSARLKLELDQVDSALVPGRGRGRISEARIQALADELKALYTALPKNEHDKLGSAAARYALHRGFRRTRGWLVRGIAPNGLAWNSSDPADALHGESPEVVESIFHQHFNAAQQSGLDLEELALLAATIEEQIFTELNERLAKAYNALGLPMTSGNVTREQAEDALDLTMMSYHAGMMKHPSVFESGKKRSRISKNFPSWPASQEFHRAVLRDEVPESKLGSQAIGFPVAQQVARAIVERFGPSQRGECESLKQTLVAREGACLGHVPLVDFYSSALNNGTWQFIESTGYLRALGALDESDPAQPNVIVPNYLDGPSNIVGESRMHAVVCQDECEPIMTRLEEGLRGPSAAPEEIFSMIKDLGEPQTLSPGLVQRLDDVAQPHGGRVLIHGRLFAQWLHHVYPRECAFPQRSGTTTPVNPSQYWGHPVESKTDLQRDVDMLKQARAHDEVERVQCPAWLVEEELVDPLAPGMQVRAASTPISPLEEPHANKPPSFEPEMPTLLQGVTVAGSMFFLIMTLAAACRLSGRMLNTRNEKVPNEAKLINVVS